MSWLNAYEPDFTASTKPAEKPTRLGTLGGLAGGVLPGFDRARSAIGLSNTQQRYELPAYGSMITAIQKAGVAPASKKIDFLGTTLMELPGRLRNPALIANDRFGQSQRAEDVLFADYAKARAANPALPDIGSRAKFAAHIAAQRQADAGAAQARIEESVLGEVGAFVGVIGAGFTDPVALMTMGIGAGAVTATTVARTIALRAVAEAGAQAGVSALMVPVLMEDAEANAFEYGWDDAALDVAAGAVLGGVVGAGSGALDAVVRARRPKVEIASEGTRDLAEQLRNLPKQTGRPLTQAQEDAIRTLETAADIEDMNPYQPGPEGAAAHAAQLEEAADALLTGRPNAGPDAPVMPVRADLAPVVAGAFDPVGYLEAARAYVAGKGSLKPEAMGKALGLTPVEAGRVLGALAATPKSGLFASKRSGVIRRVPTMTGPEDVITFLARRGGLRDDEGHDLRNHAGLGGLLVPGAGPIVRKSGGMGLDEAREILQEAGYFGRRQAIGDANAPETTTEADVLDLLARATRNWKNKSKRVYRDEDVDDALDAERQRVGDEEYADRIGTVRQQFADAGIDDLTPEELDAALRMSISDGTPDDLVEAFVMSDAWDARAALAAEKADDGFDVPWLESADDAMEAPYGRDAAEPDEFGDGFGEGGGGYDPAGSAADAGGDTGGAGARADGGEGQQSTGLGPADTAASGKAIAEFDDPQGPGAIAQTDMLLHDLRRDLELDPAIAERNRQMGQLGADSPLRPGDRAEQADVDGLPMFDAVRSPDMFATGDEANTLRAILDDLDADEAALAALRNCR